jgi:hypothetical protein
MKRSEQIGDLVAALAKAQGEFTQAVKDSDNPYYGSKYADLNAVISAVRPALNKHGIFMTHDLESDLERQCAIVTVGFYFGEQFIEETAEAPATGRAKKDERNEGVAATKFDVQTLGAAWSYLRRYTLQAICGLASEEDDDGNSLQADNKPIAKSATCPTCGKDAIIKGKAEYGGGWLCYKQKGGCGAKFTVDPSEISHQPAGASARPQETQPATARPAESQGAIQSQGRPSKRIPPDELVVWVNAVKFYPKTATENACVTVKFEGSVPWENQGHSGTVDWAGCFHGSLIELLKTTVGKKCHLQVKEGNRKKNVSDEFPTIHFIDIQEVISITDPATGEFTEYVKGKPVVQGEKQ